MIRIPKKDYWSKKVSWTKKVYRLSLEDEGHLEKVADFRLTPARTVVAVAVGLIVATLLGMLIVIATPVKTLLPGYLKERERTASEEALLRLDSLRAEYEQNEAYLRNISALLDIERVPSDSLSMAMSANRLTPDSLLEPSASELKFVKQMREREKYNITVLAPLAAESMMFYPVSDEGVVAEDSRLSHQSRVILPPGSTVGAVADGTVISIEVSGLRRTIVVQHAKGFISRYSGVASPLVGEGDAISGGQAIALAPSSTPKGAHPGIILELWHDGSPLVPYEYVNPRQRREMRQPADELDDNQL